jgi:putative peptidoglycan lipid II flippase
VILATRRAPLHRADAGEAVTTQASTRTAAGDSLTVAGWTVLSRVTGLLRIAATGALLGPTLLGNTFQFTNTVPNLLYYGLLAGSLYSSLLVPALVPYVDAHDRTSAARVAGGFLGVTLVGLAVLLPLAAVIAPAALALTAPAQSGTVEAAAQARLAALLLLMFVPQIFCYAVVGVATATMNAHGRFALAAAAPALENIGIVAVLVVAWLATGLDPARLDHVPTAELLLLGLGTTTAVAVHAAVQWRGARRAGITLRPFAGWRDPEVTRVLRRARASLGQAGGLAAQVAVLLAAANRVPGGVVGFQMALGFIYLAVAVGVTPIALASLPWLSRYSARSEEALFHDTFIRSVRLALFVAVPAAVGFLALAPALSDLVTAGRMAGASSGSLVSLPLAALALSVVAQAIFTTCSYAFYARRDTHAPLVATIVQLSVCLVGVTLALESLQGPRLLAGLGASYSAGAVAGAVCIWRLLSGRLGAGPVRLLPSVLRTACAASAMAAPAWATAHLLSSASLGPAGGALAAAAVTAVGLAVFLSVSRALGATEIEWLLSSIGRRGRPQATAAGVP